MKSISLAWLSPRLTSIGNRFGFDAHYFAKNSVIVTLSHGIAVLKGLVTGYLVTRLFPPAQYGEYKFVLSVVGFVGFVGIPGLSASLATAIARKESVSLTRVTKWYGLITLIGSVLLLICLMLLPAWGKPELWPLFLIAALLFVPNNTSNLFGGVIRGTGEFSRAFYASLTANILVALAVVIMLIVRPSSLLLLSFTIGIPSIVYLWFLIPYERRFCSYGSQRSLLKRAIHLSIATIPITASWYLDGLLISAFFGLNQLALFSVALLIPEQVKIWFKELFPILFSKQASSKNNLAYRRKMHQFTIIGTFFFGLGILCYVFITPFIIPWLFPQYPYEQLIPLTNVAAIILLTTPATIYPQFLEARGMVKEVHISNWTASFIFLIALATLIPLWGLLGALFARGIFRLVYVTTAFILVKSTPTES